MKLLPFQQWSNCTTQKHLHLIKYWNPLLKKWNQPSVDCVDSLQKITRSIKADSECAKHINGKNVLHVLQENTSSIVQATSKFSDMQVFEFVVLTVQKYSLYYCDLCIVWATATWRQIWICSLLCLWRIMVPRFCYICCWAEDKNPKFFLFPKR